MDAYKKPKYDSVENPDSDSDAGTEPDDNPNYQLSAKELEKARKDVLKEQRLDGGD